MHNYRGTLGVKALYPHLDDEIIEASQKFDSLYDVESLTTESDRLLLERNNADADLFCPVLSSGWRGSDIDALETVNDVRISNILNSRLKPLGVDIDSDLTDDELIDSVIPRNLMSSTVGSLAAEFSYLRQAVADAIANEQSSSNTVVNE